MSLHGNLLGIDTTFAAASAAVRVQREGCAPQTFLCYQEVRGGHAECLMDAIGSAMAQAAVDFSDMHALCVTAGPGSFTGTRVGIAAVRGLALATGLPVYSASSLAVIARRSILELEAQGGQVEANSIVVCTDARRGQIYFQLLTRFDQKPLTMPKIASAASIVEEISRRNEPILLIASNGVDIAQSLLDLGVVFDQGPPAALPSAEYLLDVHLEATHSPRPLYLRPPDAKAQSGKAIARQRSEG